MYSPGAKRVRPSSAVTAAVVTRQMEVACSTGVGGFCWDYVPDFDLGLQAARVSRAQGRGRVSRRFLGAWNKSCYPVLALILSMCCQAVGSRHTGPGSHTSGIPLLGSDSSRCDITVGLASESDLTGLAGSFCSTA